MLKLIQLVRGNDMRSLILEAKSCDQLSLYDSQLMNGSGGPYIYLFTVHSLSPCVA